MIEVLSYIEQQLLNNTELSNIFGNRQFIYVGNAPLEAQFPYLVLRLSSQKHQLPVIDNLELEIHILDRNKSLYRTLKIAEIIEKIIVGLNNMGSHVIIGLGGMSINSTSILSSTINYSGLVPDDELDIQHFVLGVYLKFTRPELNI